MSAVDAWRLLGTALDGATSAHEALEQGYLADWDVRKAPLVADLGALEVPVAGKYAVLRDHPLTGMPEALGVVGEAYRVVQNEDHVDLLDALAEESGATFDVAGEIDGGRRVFVTMRLPGSQIKGIETSLALVTSHDGSSASVVTVTPVHAATQTLLNCFLPGRPSVHRVHRGAGDAREIVLRSFDYLDELRSRAERMTQTELPQRKFERIVQREFGAPKDAPAATATRTENKVGKMIELFTEAGDETAWAGLIALATWSDHHAPTRGQDRDGSRARTAVLDPTFKTRAMQLMSAVK